MDTLQNVSLARFRDRRAATRYRIGDDCIAYFSGQPMHGTLINISEGGAAFRVNFSPLDGLGPQIGTLEIDGIGRLDVERVWSAADRYGVRFVHDEETADAVSDFLRQRFGD